MERMGRFQNHPLAGADSGGWVLGQSTAPRGLEPGDLRGTYLASARSRGSGIFRAGCGAGAGLARPGPSGHLFCTIAQNVEGSHAVARVASGECCDCPTPRGVLVALQTLASQVPALRVIEARAADEAVVCRGAPIEREAFCADARLVMGESRRAPCKASAVERPAPRSQRLPPLFGIFLASLVGIRASGGQLRADTEAP